jgi:hypothetical protein
MAGNNELTQSISDLRTRALALLNSCEKLEHSLPHTPEQTQGGRSWPALLSHFVLVSKQLRDLNDEVNTLSLQHYVPRPTDVAADRNGVPTMFVPLLLQTKLLPEQERDQQELLDVIRSEMETEVASLQEDAHISADDMTIEDRCVLWAEQRLKLDVAVCQCVKPRPPLSFLLDLL